ncbi:MAG: flagellar motor switch phosphatase FliY [Christensenellales bacterium]
MSNTAEEKQDIYLLSDFEQNALGEIGDICMGTAAATLSTLLNNKVKITAPKVDICRTIKELGDCKEPYVTVEVSYTEGIKGYNVLFIKEEDAMAIADILMGGDGKVDIEAGLDEMQYSAISEVMNQMAGSSFTALSNILKTPVNISQPVVRQITLDDDTVSQMLCNNEAAIIISYVMEIEGVLTSGIMQMMPYHLGKKLSDSLPNDMAPSPAPVPAPEAKPLPERADFSSASHAASYKLQEASNKVADKNRIGVKAVQYQSFDTVHGQQDSSNESRENIGFIMDVPLQVTVELGRCKKSIKEILGFNIGSVIVLDRLAGEMVDILVNGKLFAKGEVVVIDDSYGVRVTDIVATVQS